MKDLGSPSRLVLPVHQRTRFVLSRPHYPENLGASARALKTMGFSELFLLRPGRLCTKEHDMAFKMAVKAWDVLDAVSCVTSLDAAISGADHIVALTARRGIRGIQTLRAAAKDLVDGANRGKRVVLLFGNEKTGLSDEESAVASSFIRIPMVADQPSINLAQAVQLCAYELFLAALDARHGEDNRQSSGPGTTLPVDHATD